MPRATRLSMMALVLCGMFAGCSTAPKNESSQNDLIIQANATLDRFRSKDPGISDRINESAGYAVFPNIAMGGAGVGGAIGRGVVYQNGTPIGFASMSQASIGFQLGGQTYSELLIFDPTGLANFKRGEFTLGAQASAVAVTTGAAANARFQNGVMIFTMGQTGLMYAATVGGQKFSFEPM